MSSTMGAGGISADFEGKFFSTGKISLVSPATTGLLSVGSDGFWLLFVSTISPNDSVKDFGGDEQLELGQVSVELVWLFVCKSRKLPID